MTGTLTKEPKQSTALAMLISCALWCLCGTAHGDDVRVVAQRMELRTLGDALDLYRLHNGRYPSTEQGLGSLVTRPPGLPERNSWGPEPYLLEYPLDQWGNPYVYTGEARSYELTTYGADGAKGGDGASADISIEHGIIRVRKCIMNEPPEGVVVEHEQEIIAFGLRAKVYRLEIEDTDGHVSFVEGGYGCIRGIEATMRFAQAADIKAESTLKGYLASLESWGATTDRDTSTILSMCRRAVQRARRYTSDWNKWDGTSSWRGHRVACAATDSSVGVFRTANSTLRIVVSLGDVRRPEERQ